MFEASFADERHFVFANRVKVSIIILGSRVQKSRWFCVAFGLKKAFCDNLFLLLQYSGQNYTEPTEMLTSVTVIYFPFRPQGNFSSTATNSVDYAEKTVCSDQFGVTSMPSLLSRSRASTSEIVS